MRIYLKGEGQPIPELALPDPNISGDLPSQTILLEHGVPFVKAPYVDLGYTHYEVVCIGAAGGSGGRGAAYYKSRGGAGGGGGLHKVSGLLIALPEECPVVVGVSGADGADSESESYYEHVIWDPPDSGDNEAVVDTGARPLTLGGVTYINADGSMAPPYQLFNSYVVTPNPDYSPAQAGEDGGASSFNAETCRASGGKGGFPSPIESELFGNLMEGWETMAGAGGNGGAGNRTTPGGGATGGSITWPGFGEPDYYDWHDIYGPTGHVFTDPKDGTWDGTIGKGGGGGHGGAKRGMGEFNMPPEKTWPAANGGQGSFSYGDTSVYGARQLRSEDSSDDPIIPGGGGGAKYGTRKHGSHATGFSPDGAVIIRLIKIV